MNSQQPYHNKETLQNSINLRPLYPEMIQRLSTLIQNDEYLTKMDIMRAGSYFEELQIKFADDKKYPYSKDALIIICFNLNTLYQKYLNTSYKINNSIRFDIDSTTLDSAFREVSDDISKDYQLTYVFAGLENKLRLLHQTMEIKPRLNLVPFFDLAINKIQKDIADNKISNEYIEKIQITLNELNIPINTVSRDPNKIKIYMLCSYYILQELRFFYWDSCDMINATDILISKEGLMQNPNKWNNELIINLTNTTVISAINIFITKITGNKDYLKTFRLLYECTKNLNN